MDVRHTRLRDVTFMPMNQAKCFPELRTNVRTRRTDFDLDIGFRIS